MELIDKAAVVTEIEKRIKKYASIDVGNSSELEALYGAKCKALTEILSFLDTLELEVKEVDLEKEIQKHINECLDIKFPTTDIKLIAKDVEYTARKFFELGIKAHKGE